MFGIDLAQSGFLPAAFVAMLAGLLSFMSPCVLPVVPPYLAYMAGDRINRLQSGVASAVMPAIFFVLGLSTVFMAMGFTASAFGQIFFEYRDVMTKIGGAVVIIMGLHFLRVFRIPFLDQEARMNSSAKGGSAFGAYIMGLAFAFGWSPCIGPQLGMILTLAANSAELERGTALLGIYAFGLGIPFLLSAIFINHAMGLMNRIKPHLPMIERAMGVLLVIVGVMLMTGALTTISFWLLETFPALSMLG